MTDGEGDGGMAPGEAAPSADGEPAGLGMTIGADESTLVGLGAGAAIGPGLPGAATGVVGRGCSCRPHALA
jgi:hypothetical protein